MNCTQTSVQVLRPSLSFTMLFSSLFPAALAFATLVKPSPASSSDEIFKTSVVENISGPPEGWIRDDTAKLDKDNHTVKLRIHLTHQDMDKFHDLAMKVLIFLGFSKIRSNFLYRSLLLVMNSMEAISPNKSSMT